MRSPSCNSATGDLTSTSRKKKYGPSGVDRSCSDEYLRPALACTPSSLAHHDGLPSVPEKPMAKPKSPSSTWSTRMTKAPPVDSLFFFGDIAARMLTSGFSVPHVERVGATTAQPDGMYADGKCSVRKKWWPPVSAVRASETTSSWMCTSA